MRWMNARLSTILVLGFVVAQTLADEMEHEHDHDHGEHSHVEFHPIAAGSKAFHLVVSLAILFMLPCVSAVLAIADKTQISIVLHYISTGYCVFETLFWDFPNVEDYENRTSRGTSSFLSILLLATIFTGTLHNGSNIVINKFYPHLASSGQNGFTPRVYKVLSVLVSLTGWVRVCLAPVTLLGFCLGKHTGQCIAHGIMGSAFIGYSFLLSFVLLVPWIRKHSLLNPGNSAPSRSQEFYDSMMMCAWGIVNTFTEHRWGTEAWSMGDYQHTAMGIIWWAGGLLGIFLSRNNKRSFIPGLLLIFTGWSMSQHAQHLPISTKVHAVFGIALMTAGLTRIFEISFLLKDKPCSASGDILNFQYVPPFSLALSGILFMSATEEQLILVKDLGADHSAYVLVVSAAAFMIYLWFLILIHFYLRLVGYNEDGELQALGEVPFTRVSRTDVDEFELDALSDEETPNPQSH